MPTAVLLFYGLTMACCSYAAAFGGGTGRWTALLIFGSISLSMLIAHADHSYAQTHYAIFAIDTLVMLGLLGLSLTGGRYWTIWMFAFQFLSVATHVTTLVAPSYLPKVYQALANFWAIPILLVMVFGIALDRRHRGSGGDGGA